MREFFSFAGRYFGALDFERHTGMVFLATMCALCWVAPSAWPIMIALGLASAYCLTSHQPAPDKDGERPEHDENQQNLTSS